MVEALPSPTPTPPLRLPPFIFLMSDHTTRQLAVDLAEALCQRDPTVYVDDFLSPIHDGLRGMFDMDWKDDLGAPRWRNQQLNESATVNDVINSLEGWFVGQFGGSELGRLARKRAAEHHEFSDSPYLFRDATPAQVAAFINDGATIKDRDMLFVWLVNSTFPGYNTSAHVHLFPGDTAEKLVAKIGEAL